MWAASGRKQDVADIVEDIFFYNICVFLPISVVWLGSIPIHSRLLGYAARQLDIFSDISYTPLDLFGG